MRTTQRAQNLQSTLELAQIAHSKFLMANPFEQADLAKIVLSNCSVDAVSLYPTYRKPFDLIAKKAKNEEWSGREDSNLRPSAPKADALPGCATPRHSSIVARICFPLGLGGRPWGLSIEAGPNLQTRFDATIEEIHGGSSSVAERLTVAQDVVGSIPTRRPNFARTARAKNPHLHDLPSFRDPEN